MTAGAPQRAVFEGLSLDAAGTLIQVARPVAETYGGIAGEFGISLDTDALATAFRACFPRMPALAFSCSDADTLHQRERRWWHTLVRNCAGASASHPRFDAYFDCLYEHYRGRDAWRVYPDVAPLLDGLDALGMRSVVTSNFDSRLPDVLAALGVSGRVLDVLYSSRLGSAKPDGGIFAASCRALGLPASRVLHVGDDPVADLRGAHEAGMQARWLRREQHQPEPGTTIPDLVSILRLASGETDI